ncbi:PQQ-binding-like beta-propeller repeat protein [Cellulomonas sp. 179-A 9B4 NHS]|uniref:outer membrane protein assembly factor BamB family protein n=1 Tax=Cellulomonas sp. 179-A 9B4 NHS TaxID=3142379 RepID=UPI00399FA217
MVRGRDTRVVDLDEDDPADDRADDGRAGARLVRRGTGDVGTAGAGTPTAGTGGTGTAGPADADTPDDAPARTASRRRRAAAALGVVVLAAGLWGAQAAVDARERARLDDVRDVPGAVVPPPAELRVLWAAAVPPPAADGRHDPRTFAGLRTHADGATDVAAVDAATGAEHWVLPLVPPPADRGAEVFRVGSRCAAADGDRLVCLGSDATLPRPGTDDGAGEATVSRVVLVRVGDGGIEADLPARSATGVPAHTFALAGDRVVLVGVDADGTSRAWALDLATGAHLWDVALPAPAATSTLLVGVDVPWTLPDGTVGVALRDGRAVLLDPADGRVLREPLRGTSAAVVTPRLDGRVELAVPRGEDADVVRADGDVRVPGRLLDVTADDGSLPGLLLSQGGGRVHAVDARTGEVRWTAETLLPDGAAVLDGRVHVTTVEELVTLDGRTGARLWARDRAPRAWARGPVTDGTLLYEPRPADGGADRPGLVALDPADGTERADVPLPRDVWSAAPWAGRLVALTTDGVRVLG